MIDVKELRIDNLVNETFLDKTKVETVDDICNGHINPWTFDGVEGNMNKYSGITLTEDWLLKFGFDAHCYYDEIGLCTDKTWYLNDLFSLTEDFEYDPGGKIFIHLKYVHQLQNLYFALTGEELKRNY